MRGGLGQWRWVVEMAVKSVMEEGREKSMTGIGDNGDNGDSLTLDFRDKGSSSGGGGGSSSGAGRNNIQLYIQNCYV